MTREHIANRLVRDFIAKIGQSTHHAVVAPAPILPGYAHNQLLYLNFNSGAPHLLS